MSSGRPRSVDETREISNSCPQSTPDRTFHPLSRLLKELREAIWRRCLPDRVCEIDVPASELIYCDNDSRPPCNLHYTSTQNELPPLITKICHESRTVAFRAGKQAARTSEHYRSTQHWEDIWYSWTVSTTRDSRMNDWKDRVPSMVHMYWTSLYRADYDHGLNSSRDRSKSDPILWLADNAARYSSGRASIMLDQLLDDFKWEGHWNPYWEESDDEDYETPRDFGAPPKVRQPSLVEGRWIDALKRLSSCRVVMQIVVIHMDSISASRTGLFGVLGDAPIHHPHGRRDKDRSVLRSRSAERKSYPSVQSTRSRAKIFPSRTTKTQRQNSLRVWFRGISGINAACGDVSIMYQDVQSS